MSILYKTIGKYSCHYLNTTIIRINTIKKQYIHITILFITVIMKLEMQFVCPAFLLILLC